MSLSLFVAHHEFRVYACHSCGLRFLYPQPTREVLDALYGAAYFAHTDTSEPGYDRYVAEMEHIRRTFDDRIHRLPVPAPGARLLDVGAAIGLFVERANRAGWNATGVEPSEWAARYGRDVLHQPVQATSIEAAGISAASLDVVTLWEVIEHLPDPANTLDAIHQALRPGGLLALSTPDAGSLVARILGRRWPGWSKLPEHLFFFDRRTLRTVVERAGFTVMSMHYVPLFVSRRYLLDRAGQVVGIRVQPAADRVWWDRSIRINPGFDLMLIARRR